MGMIDNDVEAERARRKAYIERIRKENDEAPRPMIGAVELLQARERLRAREAAGVEDEPHGWTGVRAEDMSPLERADVMTEARRNVGANVEREGDGELIYKTAAPNRELDASQSTSTQ